VVFTIAIVHAERVSHRSNYCALQTAPAEQHA